MGRTGRSGGGSSGGRSFSGGGSRSFSGGMSSSSRSASRTSERSSSSRSFGSSRPPIRVNTFGGGNTYFGGSRYSRRRPGCSPGCSPGCLTIIILAIILFFVLPLVMNFIGSSSRSPEISTTIEREPLPLSMSTEVGYYTDTLGWIKKPNTLEKGMKEFYKETGVQPHLYILGSINGNENPDQDTVEKWASEKYDDLFSDEAHLLVIFLDNGFDWGHWIMGGKETKTVLDGEAIDIIHNYIDRYVQSDLDDEEMFSTVFSKSATSIMTVYKSPWPKIVWTIAFMIIGIIALSIILNNRRKKKEQQLKENEQTIEILNTPIESIKGHDKADELKDKYK